MQSAIRIRSFLSGENKELPYYILIFISFLFFILLTNLFVELTEELKGPSIELFDTRVMDFFISLRSPGLTDIVVFITNIGDIYGYLVLTTIAVVVFFWNYKSLKFSLQLIGIQLISILSNIALKRVIDRARPSEEHLVVIKSLSYPSGHAMSAIAFYGFLIYLLFQVKMPKALRLVLIGVFIFMILAIGLSRIYLGVHYPSDVVGGFIAGLIWVTFCITLFNIIDVLRRRSRK